jgi:glc operon protein GlcG
MSNNKTEVAIEERFASSNPLDAVPDEMPFDVPYGPPISLDRAQAVIHAAVAEAKKRNWKMNVAVAYSGGNLVSNEWTARCLPPFRLRSTRRGPPRRSGARPRSSRMVSSSCVSTICSRSTESLRPGRHSADRGGQDYRRDRCSGGADSQDEVVSKAGAAVINQLPATNN